MLNISLYKNRFVSIGILIDAEIPWNQNAFFYAKKRENYLIFLKKNEKTQQFAVFSLA